jgi:peptidoglycan/LPS O-acetylase OafA/YrhL
MAASFGLNLRIFHVTDSLGSWLLVGSYALASLGSVFLLLAFLGLSPGQLPRWAIYLGRISFGLYVYHQFAIDIARYVSPEIQRKFNTSSYAPRALLNVGLTLGLPLALTVLMAAISYRYFETPFLKMKKRHAVIESEPIADGA